jgi:hypothetical protein
MGSVADKVLEAVKQPMAIIRAKGACPDMLVERNILSKILVAV